ncbi:MAG: glycosyltransferase, partial [bacterium]
HEVNYLKEINPKAKVYWIPPILPEPYFNDMKNKENESNLFNKLREKLNKYRYRILFTGDLKRASNTIACLWFAKEVFPIIKKNLDACFIMVGKNPSKEIIDLAKQEDIFVFPNVPTMKPFYEISDLVVAPLFNPAGIKLKLLEALRYRKKVVARPEALLGAGLEDVVPHATDPEEFAKKCIDVLEDLIDYGSVWEKFDEIYDTKKIVQLIKKLILL